MSTGLVLYNGPTSPFGRKCKATGLYLNIQFHEKVVNVYQAEFLDQYNPLRQIPTLILNERAITDSDNICLYFNQLSGSNTFINSGKYWETMSFVSIANGIMEYGLQRFIEISTHGKEYRQDFVNRCEIKINRSINWLENNNYFIGDKITLDQIAIACALEYTNFRYSDEWKSNNPNLSNWLNKFNEHEFMKNTHPGVSFKYE